MSIKEAVRSELLANRTASTSVVAKKVNQRLGLRGRACVSAKTVRAYKANLTRELRLAKRLQRSPVRTLVLSLRQNQAAVEKLGSLKAAVRRIRLELDLIEACGSVHEALRLIECAS